MGTLVRIVDAAGDDIGAGGTGELLIQSETVMKGYWNLPAETAETSGTAGCTPETSPPSTTTATSLSSTGSRT